METSTFIIALFIHGMTTIGAVIGLYVKIIERLARLESQSESYKENIENLWNHHNQRKIDYRGGN